MKISPAVAKKITNDWQQEFPGLGCYKPMQLMRRFGPVLVGLCLNRTSSGDVYKPILQCHCLLRKFPAITLSLGQYLKAANGSEAAVPIRWHEAQLAENAAKMRSMALLPLDGDLTLSQFDCACRGWLSQQQRPYWPLVFEDRILLHAWAGRDCRPVIRDAEVEMKSWPSFVTDKFGGISTWLARVERLAEDRNALEESFRSEIVEHRLGKLPTGEFVV